MKNENKKYIYRRKRTMRERKSSMDIQIFFKNSRPTTLSFALINCTWFLFCFKIGNHNDKLKFIHLFTIFLKTWSSDMLTLDWCIHNKKIILKWYTPGPKMYPKGLYLFFCWSFKQMQKQVNWYFKTVKYLKYFYIF